MRADDLAADHYREAARFEGELRRKALEVERLCDRIAEAVAIGVDRIDPLAESPTEPPPLDPDRGVSDPDERVALLSLLLDEVRNTHYEANVREEIERTD